MSNVFYSDKKLLNQQENISPKELLSKVTIKGIIKAAVKKQYSMSIRAFTRGGITQLGYCQ